LFGLLFLVVPASGCNSGTGDSDTPHPLARVESAAEGGAFRNLGKRSTFDYGSVEPRHLERNPVGDTRTTLGNWNTPAIPGALVFCFHNGYKEHTRTMLRTFHAEFAREGWMLRMLEFGYAFGGGC
jgi:hypothetical protein